MFLALLAGRMGKEVTKTQVNKSAPIELKQIDSLITAAGVDGTRAILDAFQRSTADLLTMLAHGIQDGALEDAYRTAHAVKGSAANVGATMLSETESLRISRTKPPSILR